MMRSAEKEDLDHHFCAHESGSLYPKLEDVLSTLRLYESEILRVLSSFGGTSFMIDDNSFRNKNESHNERNYYRLSSDDMRFQPSHRALALSSTTPSLEISRRPAVVSPKHTLLNVQGSHTNLPAIEVSPGIFMELRGSSESWEAVESGKVVVTTCPACALSLRCIQDAECVLCPDCRVVSPIEGAPVGFRSGLGLGVKLEL